MPSTNSLRLQGFQRANSIVKTSENPCRFTCNATRGFSGSSPKFESPNLGMNTFLAESMMAGSSTSTVTIWPTAGRGKAAPSVRQATSNPLRLMFFRRIALRNHSAGDVTWHRSLISIRGLSRLFIFLISLVQHWRLYPPAAPGINAVNGLYGVVAEVIRRKRSRRRPALPLSMVPGWYYGSTMSSQLSRREHQAYSDRG